MRTGKSRSRIEQPGRGSCVDWTSRRLGRSRTITLSGAAPVLGQRPNLNRISGPCVVDLSQLTFATPLDLVAIASVLATPSKAAGVTLIPPSDTNVANYLLRMDLPASFDGRVVISPPFLPEAPRDETPSLIELTRVSQPGDVQPIVDRLMPKLATVLPEATCRDVFRIISELLENAATHGQSPVGSFIAAQYYTGATSGMPPGFWIGVADSGVGFRANLARKAEYRDLDSMDAIRVASRPGVSSSDDPSRGLGLASVRRAAGHEARGVVIIRSGDGEGRFFVGPQGATARYRPLPRIRGTWILALAGAPPPVGS